MLRPDQVSAVRAAVERYRAAAKAPGVDVQVIPQSGGAAFKLSSTPTFK